MIDPFNAETGSNKITLREVFSPMTRHRRSAIAGFIVTFAFANIIAWVWAANYYKAQMQIVVEQDRSDPVVTSGQDSSVGQSKQITTDQVSSEVALLQGGDMLQAAADACGLADPATPSLLSRVLPGLEQPSHAVILASATAKLAKRLTVEAEPTSDVISVSYGHRGSPETPACVLSQLSQLYIQKHLRLRRQLGSARLFSEETERFRQALAASEARVSDFGRSSGSGDPEQLKVALAQQVALSEAALYRAKEATVANQNRMRDIENQMHTVPPRSEGPKQETAAYFLIQKLQGDLLTAEIKRTELITKYDPSYPLVKEIDREIEETKVALEESRHTTYDATTTDRDATFEALRQDFAKSEADLATSTGTANAVGSTLTAMRAQMISLDQQAIQKASLEREMKANEAKYLMYLNKREQERISEALDKRGIADVAISVTPTVPVLPAYNPLLILALGSLLSLIVAVSLAYAAEYLDPFLRTPDIDRELGLPVIAEFPA